WTWLSLDELADLESGLGLEGQEEPDGGTAREAEIVDGRLERKVSVRSKGGALGDLCHALQEETGIRLEAAPEVADEKVTFFCRERPLRAVMRAVSSLLGFTWQRSGAAGRYGYELRQERRSLLLEEALRERDRNA